VSVATTDYSEISQKIAEGELDDLAFRGELVDGRLVTEGLLADQEAIDAIPVCMYVIEPDGLLITCNEAAIGAWGRTPELGTSERYCGAHILRYPSGEVMPHDQAPPKVVTKNGATVRNADVVCEQPSGARLLALVNVFPIRNSEDEVVGAVNIFRHNTSKTVPGLIA
jgi:hypothetical protein